MIDDEVPPTPLGPLLVLFALLVVAWLADRLHRVWLCRVIMSCFSTMVDAGRHFAQATIGGIEYWGKRTRDFAAQFFASIEETKKPPSQLPGESREHFEKRVMAYLHSTTWPQS